MLNFSLISLISFILIYQNVILLNEETLILICFISFSLISFNKLSETIYIDLSMRSLKTKTSLVNSLNQLLDALVHDIKFQKELKNFTNNFNFLKLHFLKLSGLIAHNLPIYSINRSKILYPKKIKLIQNTENQITKLLALLLIHKLNKIVEIQRFCKCTLKTSYFLCFDKISLREHFSQLKN